MSGPPNAGDGTQRPQLGTTPSSRTSINHLLLPDPTSASPPPPPPPKLNPGLQELLPGSLLPRPFGMPNPMLQKTSALDRRMLNLLDSSRPRLTPDKAWPRTTAEGLDPRLTAQLARHRAPTDKPRSRTTATGSRPNEPIDPSKQERGLAPMPWRAWSRKHRPTAHDTSRSDPQPPQSDSNAKAISIIDLTDMDLDDDEEPVEFGFDPQDDPEKSLPPALPTRPPRTR